MKVAEKWGEVPEVTERRLTLLGQRGPAGEGPGQRTAPGLP